MRKINAITAVAILISFFSYCQQNSVMDDFNNGISQLSFYYDYEWNEKNQVQEDETVYRVKLKKLKELNDLVSINRSFDSTEEKGKLRPFLTGVSGWDPVENVIRFLDFSRDGMMIEGTILLIDDKTIQYDFEFAVPGNNKKLIGRDVLKFNNAYDEFIWTSFYKPPEKQYTQISETVMKRGVKIVG